MITKIKVEIWSDMVCPFCYIGKKNFNDALQNFEHKSEVEIVWRSFYLNKELNITAPLIFHLHFYYS